MSGAGRPAHRPWHHGRVLDVRRARWLLGLAVGLVVLGLVAFLLRGADGPADPYLEGSPSAAEPGATSSTAAPAASAPSPTDGSVAPGDSGRVLLEGFDEVAIAVAPADGSALLRWCLLAALRAEQRSRGLMEVTDLQGYSGMAFVYEDDVNGAFYMRNTPTPLSIAWIDSTGRLVSTADMDPCEDREGCPTYAPAGSYRYAIEVFQGGLDDLGITPGATVTVGGSCAPRA